MRHYKKQQHKSRSFLLNKNLVLVSACNTVIPWPALIFFEWLRKVTIRSVFFSPGSSPCFAHRERLFQLSVNYTIWIDCWWIKRQGTFSQCPKVFVWKTFFPFSRPGEFEQPILSVVNFDQHERCISINLGNCPIQFLISLDFRKAFHMYLSSISHLNSQYTIP